MTQPDPAELRRVVNRLKRARGQLTAVIDAMETGADCRDVVTQLAAVGKAIDRAGFVVVSTAMRTCLVDAEGGGEPDRDDDPLTLDELEKLFLSLT